MLVLHIGLAKTGTTFLQYKVFARSPSLTFLHRKRGKLAFRITRGLRAFGQAEKPEARQLRITLNRLLKRIEPGTSPVVVSDENIAVGPGLFWTGRPAKPAKVARRIASLRKSLPPELLPLKVLVGIREQDQWLASCYAEASLRFPGFDQADFNRRIAEIAGLGETDPSLGWLDYQRAREALANALGPENVLLLPLERLSSAPADALGQLSGFLGGVDLLGAHPAEVASQPSNQLSSGNNMWRLRRDGSPLQLDPGLQHALRQRFAASNRALANEMPLGFRV